MVTNTNETFNKNNPQKSTSSDEKKVSLKDILESFDEKIGVNPNSVSVRSFVKEIYPCKETDDTARKFLTKVEDIMSHFKREDNRKPNVLDWFRLNLTKIVTLLRYLDQNNEAVQSLENTKNFVELQQSHVVNEADLIDLNNKGIDQDPPEYTNLRDEQEDDHEQS